MIEIKNFSYTLDSFHIKDISLSIREGEYFVILGPTGAGKTVLIECIAGLHRGGHGEIWVDGKNMTHLTPEDRAVGYVPQDYVLFPFLNVEGNITFGLRKSGYLRSSAIERLETVSRMLSISHLMDRDVRSLSGGEKQRVALARALAPKPRILLLDEPLSSIDQQTSKHLRLELRRIHREFGVTMLHITHNQAEAEELADRIAVMNMGELEQVGKPEEVFFYPKSEVVSGFIGAPNILEVEYYRDLGQGLMEVICDGLPIILPHEGNAVKRIALSPRDIYVSDIEPPGPGVNRFTGIVNSIKPSGAVVRMEIKVGKHNLRAEVPQHIFDEMNIEVGSGVFLILKLRRVRVC